MGPRLPPPRSSSSSGGSANRQDFVWTTPTDLATFAIRIQQAFAGARDRLLNRALTQVMLSPGLKNWGLGPVVSEGKVRFGHGGSNQGFRCQFWAFINGGAGVVGMTNSDSVGPLIEEIITSVAKIYGCPDI